ncbi:tyrosine-type recombinase/integrase [Leptospirillum ferrooxidans]|uniref:Putative phage integrase family protein n=1 Tax=Leptospirillum ferrooxidans (strain C2-3) TaxID=1162668 RepID=I0ILE4_LEPFC|nr:site-specific integrase [Leptospirillum ferrooxidans]BAM06093.1 putative phage integrase family protein [Leptospirillum ferrooxidans C2-3]
MASFYKRKLADSTVWEAKIRRKGYPAQMHSFDKREDAEKWAREIESEIDRGIFVSRKEAENTTLSEALSRYEEEVSKYKKGYSQEKKRIRSWKVNALAQRYLATIRPQDIFEYEQARRGAGISERTIRLDLAIVSHLFNVAREHWDMPGLVNPIRRTKGTNPGKKANNLFKSRERTLSFEEQNELLKHLSKEMQHIVLLAVETGMRRGEIMSLTRTNIDINRKIVKLEETKNGSSREVPLSTVALETLKEVLNSQVIGIKGNLWGIGPDRVSQVFAAAAKSTGLKDIRFHDLRHTAATRLAGIYQAHELAKILGHKVLNMVMRYYNPTGEELGKKMWESSTNHKASAPEK